MMWGVLGLGKEQEGQDGKTQRRWTQWLCMNTGQRPSAFEAGLWRHC